jgi:hypothetical protein
MHKHAQGVQPVEDSILKAAQQVTCTHPLRYVYTSIILAHLAYIQARAHIARSLSIMFGSTLKHQRYIADVADEPNLSLSLILA